MPNMAYVCRDDVQGVGGVVFAESRGKAKYFAMGEMDTCEFTDVRLRREPKYDQYNPGPVPVEVLLGDGWFFACGNCGHHVYEDGCPVCETAQPVIVKGRVFCSEKCSRLLQEYLNRGPRRSKQGVC